MRKRLKFWVCVAAIGFVCVSCAGIQRSQNKTIYYLLEYDPPLISTEKAVPQSLRVKRFDISPEYDTDRIVFSDKKLTREEYAYHKWRSNPRDLVSYCLTRDLARSKLFNAVFTHYTLEPTTYSITGTVEEFFENGDDSWEAVLSVNVALLKENEPDPQKRIIFQKFFSVHKPCTEKSPAGIAEAMGSAMKEISENLISEIKLQLSGGHSNP
jgi:ABC-type uncharacterized transport system auxiliary subunit